MTLNEIRASDKEFLTPQEVAEVLGCATYAINTRVKEDLARGVNSLGFNYIKIGSRVKIPRLAFLKFMDGT